MGAGFVAKCWLEDDGDLAPQDAAAARPGFAGPKGAVRAVIGTLTVWHFTGKRAPELARGACSGGAIIVLNEDWGSRPPSDCEVFDRWRLRRTGSVAIDPGDASTVVMTAREAAGDRLWNRRAERWRPDGGSGPPSPGATAALQ
jgi:competence protein ComEC